MSTHILRTQYQIATAAPEIKHAPQCDDEQSNQSVEDKNRAFYWVTKHGLEILNLHCLRSYLIRNTFTNFETYLVLELWLS